MQSFPRIVFVPWARRPNPLVRLWVHASDSGPCKRVSMDSLCPSILNMWFVKFFKYFFIWIFFAPFVSRWNCSVATFIANFFWFSGFGAGGTVGNVVVGYRVGIDLSNSSNSASERGGTLTIIFSFAPSEVQYCGVILGGDGSSVVARGGRVLSVFNIWANLIRAFLSIVDFVPGMFDFCKVTSTFYY